MTEGEKEIELIKNIVQTSKDLNTANGNFEFAQDDLIDYYAYQIKANQSKLNYLIKMAKSKGLAVDIIGDFKYRMLKENDKAV